MKDMKNQVKCLNIYTLFFRHWCFISNSQFSAGKKPKQFWQFFEKNPMKYAYIHMALIQLHIFKWYDKVL